MIANGLFQDVTEYKQDYEHKVSRGTAPTAPISALNSAASILSDLVFGGEMP
jgi:hypothetical protein